MGRVARKNAKVPQEAEQEAAPAENEEDLEKLYKSTLSPFAGFHPDVLELADQYNLPEHVCVKLQTIMQERQQTWRGDFEKLWEDLGNSRNPPGMCMHRIREMQAGKFMGKHTVKEITDPEIMEMVSRFKLDDNAASRLNQYIHVHPETRERDINDLTIRLQTSSNPSPLCMAMVAKLQKNEKLPEPREEKGKGKGKRKDDDKGRGKGRDRDDDREARGRDDRDYDRRRDRGRDDRGRDDRDYDRRGRDDRGRDDRGRDDRGGRDRADDRGRDRSRNRDDYDDRGRDRKRYQDEYDDRGRDRNRRDRNQEDDAPKRRDRSWDRPSGRERDNNGDRKARDNQSGDDQWAQWDKAKSGRSSKVEAAKEEVDSAAIAAAAAEAYAAAALPWLSLALPQEDASGLPVDPNALWTSTASSSARGSTDDFKSEQQMRLEEALSTPLQLPNIPQLVPILPTFSRAVKPDKTLVEKVEEFLAENKIDERGGTLLRYCLPEVQERIVRGDPVRDCEYPSAALTSRIHEMVSKLVKEKEREDIIRMEAAAHGGVQTAGPVVVPPPGMGPPGVPVAGNESFMSQEDYTAISVESFIEIEGIDESAADYLRKQPHVIQKAFLEEGVVNTQNNRNPSAAVIRRIKRLQEQKGFNDTVGAPREPKGEGKGSERPAKKFRVPLKWKDCPADITDPIKLQQWKVANGLPPYCPH